MEIDVETVLFIAGIVLVVGMPLAVGALFAYIARRVIGSGELTEASPKARAATAVTIISLGVLLCANLELAVIHFVIRQMVFR